MNRREFIEGAAATLAAGYANSGVNLLAQGAGDLRAAFRALGFNGQRVTTDRLTSDIVRGGL